MIISNISIYLVYTFMLYGAVGCTTQYFKKNSIFEFSLEHSNQLQNSIDSKQQIDLENIYDTYIHRCAEYYGVDEYLIKAIIKVESNYNPNVISKSNAIGLMQLKANTAGKDAYRLKGWAGQPSSCDLKNGIINIDLGTAYLSILQKQLDGIINIKTRRYALIVSYVNGLGALLKIFSTDRFCAIEQINKLNPDQFYQYIQYHHPSQQAQRYLSKVNSIYNSIK